MKPTTASQLWLKYKSGQCSEAESELVERWFYELNLNEASGLSALEIEQAHEEMLHKVQSQVGPRSTISRLWPWMAAAVLVFISGSYFFTAQYEQQKPMLQVGSQPRILPGGNNAVLTLANGKSINLNQAANGKLQGTAGITITKQQDGQLVYTVQNNEGKREYSNELNTVTTPKGGQYQINLPDGTKVWLNAATSLQFPVSFAAGKKREVTLIGEAYFEVTKNSKPFVVATQNQQVSVLGTHFSVNSYPNENTTKTTLLEGSVMVSLTGANASERRLKPNQQSVIVNGTLKVKEVDAEEAIDWKNGYFIFNNESLESIMRKVSRWYDMDITVSADEKLMQKEFSGTVSRFSEVADVLEMLELTDGVHFKVKERRIIIMK